MSDAMNSEAGYDVFSPEAIAAPYPAYRWLQAEKPRFWNAERGIWVFTRHADVAALLAHPTLSAQKFSAAGLAPEFRPEFGPLYEMLSRQMLFLDPPHQTRLRSLAAKAFTPRVIERLRSQVQRWTDEFLDTALAVGPLDIVRDLANPLPATVIAEMLGVPPEDRDRFKHWSDNFADFLGTDGSDWEATRPFLPGIYHLMDYLHSVVDRTRAAPGDNLLSALIEVEEQGDKLTEEELIANCLLLLVAGHETTTNLIGNGCLALLTHPEQAARLRHDDALLPTAIEELLRYESPVQWTSRIPKEAVMLDGLRIEAGQFVMLGLGAANRDSTQFTDPDRLDITRREGRHLAFGWGVHYCLGAALARMEGQIALGTLLRRFPDLRLAEGESLRWRPNFIFRGLEALRVDLTPARAPTLP